MAQKIIDVIGVGPVTLQKRKGSKSLRLSITSGGNVKVSIPSWTPYHAAEAFVLSKIAWINKQQASSKIVPFVHGDRVGKHHRVEFRIANVAKPAGRITKTAIVVTLPPDMLATDKAAQSCLSKAAIRALKQESSHLLPQRLDILATQHGFTYNSLAIKQLKARWGSCSSKKDIALNCYLMQLPWELIDYVLLHELVHTKIMAHGNPFWTELGEYVTNLPLKRKEIRGYQPILLPQDRTT
ncbi:MAG: YgjP-like metallopeptidase domain-containing protein [Candidatus Saccharimonadales bacterium]